MAQKDLDQDILDHALEVGDRIGWERLSLTEVAEAAGVTLGDVYTCFPQKDDLVDAWYTRADKALLKQAPNASWAGLDAQSRIERVIWTWLEALSPYRELSGQMLLYKLEPGHIHLQVGGLLRISRTVQWFREAAGLRVTHGLRVVQESVLTAAFVSTFVFWLRDSSVEQYRSRRLLRQQLAGGALVNLWR
jgi:AcrR family transcriptional regulator